MIGVILSLFVVLTIKVTSISVCNVTNSIFIFDISLINEFNESIVTFLDSIVYEANHERSGIGLIAMGQLNQNILLNISNTAFTSSTYNSRKYIRDTLHDYLKNNNNNTDNIRNIDISDALNDASKMFRYNHNNIASKNIFIVDDGKKIQKCNNYIKYINYNNDSISLYFLSIFADADADADNNNSISIEFIYDCIEDKISILDNLHDIICPSHYNFNQFNMGKFNKKVQLLELCSIHSCNGSNIIVYDTIYNEMSYEVGYILVLPYIVYQSLPNNCHLQLPIMKILNIDEIESNDIYRILRINITNNIALYEYMNTLNVNIENQSIITKLIHNNTYNDIYNNICFNQLLSIYSADHNNYKRRRRLIECTGVQFWDPNWWKDCLAAAAQKLFEFLIEEIFGSLGNFDFSIDSQGSFGDPTDSPIQVRNEYSVDPFTAIGIADVKIYGDYIVLLAPSIDFQINFGPNLLETFKFAIHGNAVLSLDVTIEVGGKITLVWKLFKLVVAKLLERSHCSFLTLKVFFFFPYI